MATDQPRDLTQTTLQVLSLGILIAAGLWIALPFLLSAIWASMVVVATWPVMLRIEALLGGRRAMAATLMTVILLMAFVLPFSVAALTLVQDSGAAIAWLQSLHTKSVPPPPGWLAEVPIAGAALTRTWRELISGGTENLVAKAAPYLTSVFQWFVSSVGGLGALVVQFFLTVIISGILYVNGEKTAHAVRLFGRRIAGAAGEESMILAGKAIRGIALGVVVTALAQTVAGGIGLAVAGVPAATILTVVMFVLCIAQVGPGLVLLPAIGWLYWTGSHLPAGLLLLYCIPVMTMDNVLRPMLIRKGVDLPILLILSGVIGGLVSFGVVGIFVGPVVLAVGYTLLSQWVLQGNQAQP
jgi:predicted PurR-regulated permease PerM